MFGRVTNDKASIKRDRDFENAQKVLNNKLAESQILELEAEEQYDANKRMILENSSLSRQNSNRMLNTLKFKYQDQLKHQLFVESVFSIFMESLVLDDEFKLKYSNNFYNLTEDMINNIFDTGKTSYSKLKSESSQMVKDLIELCEDTAKKQTDKEFKDVKVDKMSKSKILNEKDAKVKEIDPLIKGDFDDLKKVDSQNVANIVKDKVVKVVRDEQELAQKEQEQDEEIKSKTEPTGTDLEVEPSVMSESGRIISQLSGGSNKVLGTSRLQEHTLFKSLQLNIASKNLKHMKDTLSEDASLDLDMDLVFSESLTTYTLLETLYTTRIIDFNSNDARSFAKELVFNK